MILVCTECKSPEVYTDMWQNLNNNSIIEGAGEQYCKDCGSECNTEYGYEDEKRVRELEQINDVLWEYISESDIPEIEKKLEGVEEE